MKHDENKDLKSISNIAKVNFADKTIRCSKNAKIGIRRWGKIDYLTKYCGWHLIWDGSAGVGGFNIAIDSNDSIRAQKKAKKEPKLTDKTKKVSKRK